MTWYGIPDFCPDNSDCAYYKEHCDSTERGEICLKKSPEDRERIYIGISALFSKLKREIRIK